MEDREEQHRRLTEPHRSKATKLAWKRHHNSYMQGVRKRERDNMNKSFYDVAKQLECLMNESEIEKDNVFELSADIIFNNVSGGVSFKINKDNGEVSFSTNMQEVGSGSYKLQSDIQTEDAYKQLYEDLKDELSSLCETFDTNIQQILAKHGLKSTK